MESNNWGVREGGDKNYIILIIIYNVFVVYTIIYSADDKYILDRLYFVLLNYTFTPKSFIRLISKETAS